MLALSFPLTSFRSRSRTHSSARTFALSLALSLSVSLPPSVGVCMMLVSTDVHL